MISDLDLPPSNPPPDVPTGEEPAKENGANGATTPEKPAEAKKEVKSKKPAKEPIDPRVDPVGWLNDLARQATHKINHVVLDWTQKLAVPDESQRQPLPGKNEFVTKNQFLGFLRDGTLLAKLANALQPGAVETVHEGDAAKEKENQETNINQFITFAKEKIGLPEDKVFSVEDLTTKGKAGYNNVINTLVAIATQAKEKFDKDGLDFESLTQIAQSVPTNIIQVVLNFFRKARPQSAPKIKAEETEETQKVVAASTNAATTEAAAAVPATTEVEEEVAVKVDVSAPAPVAAN